jgi:RNA polymerase sigma-54 factor
MRFDTSQHLRLSQSLKLAPRMIQSMEILQMSLADLQERIEQELENNPTLEVAEETLDRPADPGADIDRPMEISGASASDDFARLDDFESENPDAARNEFTDPVEDRPSRDDRFEDYRPTNRADDGDSKMAAMDSAPARAASLGDQLRDQWALCDVEPALRPLGELLISFLDEDGYLRTPLETVADRAPLGADGVKPSVEQLERALKALQLFLEPAGLGARNARECLMLQLDALHDDPTLGNSDIPSDVIDHARVIVSDHLDDLMQNRLPRIAEKAGITVEEIKRAVMLLRKLSLSPGRRLSSPDATPVIPDAIIEYDAESDRYVAFLNDTRMHNLRVNQEYAHLARDRAQEKRTREFVKTNLSNAQWLIDAVEQRRRTLLKVAQVVADAQRDFFDYGPQALKPLPMTQVAEQIGVHVATVSRAVAEKYVQTPRGVLPLRRFFSGGTQTDSGEEVAWDAIRQALKEIIDAEDKAKPLSDDALTEALKNRGIEIARRTVAKYRDQLNIPTARLRKAY